MYKLSERSQKNLVTCHINLQRLARETLKYINIGIICGHRTEEAQNKAYAEGKSKLKWPDGKHNMLPSLAMDIIIYPLSWTDYMRWHETGYFMLGLSKGLGIEVIWGGDWNSNYISTDQQFMDLGHFELLVVR